MNNKFFYKRYFKVIPKVFYPRFETEQFVTLILKYATFFFDKFPLHVLELGVGSGVISVSLLDGKLNCDIDALDINKRALKLSKINGEKYLNKNLFIFESDLFENVSKKYHLIVANLPYVGLKDDYDHNILKWDPREALFSGDDGMIHFERFFKQVKSYLCDDYLIALEISPSQKQKIITLISKYLGDRCYFFEKDYQNLTRFVFIYKKKMWKFLKC